MLLACVLTGLALSASAEMRIWTSVKGDTVEAEFKTIVSGRVILHKPDGKELKVPMSGLCSADIKYLETKIPPTIDIDVNVDRDKTKLESTSFYSYSYEKEEIKVKCEVSITKKSREASAMPLKACIYVFSADTRSKEMRVVSRTEKDFIFNSSKVVTFSSDVAKFQNVETSGYGSGTESGQEYEGYVAYVENKAGDLIAVRGSSKSYEKNLERIKNFKSGTKFDDDFDIIK
jgi:hypothetical protein